MSQSMLDRIIEEARALSLEEQRQLRNRLDEWLQSQGKQRQLEQMLLDAGLMVEIPPSCAGSALARHFQPVEVRGRHISETIIQERDHRL